MSRGPDPVDEAQPGSGPMSNPFGSAMEQFGQSWTKSLDVWSAWANAWGTMLQSRGPAAGDVMGKLLNPLAWPGGLPELSEELEDLLALPRFADLPALNAGALPSFAPAMELMAVAQQYLAAAAPVWVRACQRFQAEASERRGRGEKLDSAGEAMDLWNEVLDRTLMEFNRSADYAKVQQRFLRAAMRQRLEVRKTFERAAQAVDLPTGAEMKDVYRRIHDLLREVHALKREVRALKAEANGRSAPEGSAEAGPTTRAKKGGRDG